jgi:hypothetical protein
LSVTRVVWRATWASDSAVDHAALGSFGTNGYQRLAIRAEVLKNAVFLGIRPCRCDTQFVTKKVLLASPKDEQNFR